MTTLIALPPHSSTARLLCLLVFLLLPFTVSAQLSFSSSDEYAGLIFEPVGLPLETGTPFGQSGLQPDINSAPANLAETTDSDSPLRGLGDYETAINQAIEEGGLYSERLREQYQSLGLLQQRLGQHEAAVATFENAMHITRVNDGLFTPLQISDVENILPSLIALGDKKREAEYRGYLFYVQEKAYTPNDPRLLAAMEDWADWNMQTYQQSTSADPHSIQLKGTNYSEEIVVVRNSRTGQTRFVQRKFMLQASDLASTSFYDGSRYSLMPEMMVDDRLDKAQDSLSKVLENGSETLDAEALDAIRLKLVATDYAFKRQMDSMLGSNQNTLLTSTRPIYSQTDMGVVRRGYTKSIEMLQAIIERRSNDPEIDVLALAQAHINLADTYIAYNEPDRAQDSYLAAVKVLTDSGLETDAIKRLLNPQVFTAVPAFATHYYSRQLFGIAPDDRLDYRGYIDVSLSINRYGDARRVEITEVTEGTPRRLRNKLLDYLRDQKLRPVLQDGELKEIRDLQVRFYYLW